MTISDQFNPKHIELGIWILNQMLQGKFYKLNDEMIQFLTFIKFNDRLLKDLINYSDSPPSLQELFNLKINSELSENQNHEKLKMSQSSPFFVSKNEYKFT